MDRYHLRHKAAAVKRDIVKEVPANSRPHEKAAIAAISLVIDTSPLTPPVNDLPYKISLAAFLTALLSQCLAALRVILSYTYSPMHFLFFYHPKLINAFSLSIHLSTLKPSLVKNRAVSSLLFPGWT